MGATAELPDRSGWLPAERRVADPRLPCRAGDCIGGNVPDHDGVFTTRANARRCCPHLAVLKQRRRPRAGLSIRPAPRNSGDVVSPSPRSTRPRESNLVRRAGGTGGGIRSVRIRICARFRRVYGEAFDPRTELWWPLLMAALVILMLEHSLAWWFGTRDKAIE